MRLKNQVVIVTGGSSGLGRAMSKRFAAEGAEVVIADLSEVPREGGKSTVETIRKNKGKASFFKCDVSNFEDMDSLIFANEPYFTTDHVNKKLPLIQTWSKMYGLKYKGEMPQITFNHLQKKIAKDFWTTRANGKPIMVIQTNGGLLNEQRPYLWARDMPITLAQKLVDHYEKDYHIFQITKPAGEVLDGVEVIKDPMSNMELVSILLQSEKRIFIDSCMQHAAAALKMPSVVLWNGTSPKVFGWDMHTNIQARKPAKFKLPNSVFFDFDFIGVEAEYPYVDEDEEIFDFDKIIEAVG